jgi:hypothetical protein
MTDVSPSGVHPFPSDLGDAPARVVESLASSPRGQSAHSLCVIVSGERITIPRRIYVFEPDFRFRSPKEQRFVDCLLTRHHDGFVRERALERVFGINAPWSIPYIVQLMGEYVIEILDQIDSKFDRIDSAMLGAFVLENPSFIRLTKQRVQSYWHCYYRWKFEREDYVGFRLMHRLDEVGLAAS